MPSLRAVWPWFRWRNRSASKRAVPDAQRPSTEIPGAADREGLRQAHGVRLVSEQEEGQAVYRLPPGVYGFTYAPGLADAPLFRKKSYGSFELHVLADGTPAIVGFATAEHAAALTAGRESELTLFPDPRDEAALIVTVPYRRITVCREVSQHTARQGGLRIRVGPPRPA